MSTLSNVTSPRDGSMSQHTGFAPDVHPEAAGSQTGESVENVRQETEEEISEAEKRYPRDDKRQWYVLRATFNRARQAYGSITTGGTSAYIPMRYVCRLLNNHRTHRLEPFIPNLIFVYCTKEQAEKLVRDTPDMPYLSYYYNHFRLEDGKNIPLTIDYDSMMNFINATIACNEHTMMVKPGNVRYKTGDLVRIKEGDFKNVEGRVARVAGQQRVVVEIKDFGLIATAYIPSGFLEYL